MNTLRARIASGARARGVRSALLCGAALGGFAAMPSVAYAQDAETAETAPEDRVIIVQARRQNETLQEVPVTVTAIGGDTLQRFNIDQVADVTSRVPTLNVQSGGSGSGGQISLRGVGSSNISAAFDSAVAFEYDGVVVSTMRMVQAGFFDVEQIDVLRGPQSLFFGKSATAGVLSLRSANPTANWEVGMRASYEFEEKGYLLSGYISGPVTDTLGIRIAAQFNDIDEFQLLQANTPAVNQKRGIDLQRCIESKQAGVRQGLLGAWNRRSQQSSQVNHTDKTTAQIGYTQRRHDDAAVPDFSGITGQASYRRRFSGVSELRLEAYREVMARAFGGVPVAWSTAPTAMNSAAL